MTEQVLTSFFGRPYPDKEDHDRLTLREEVPAQIAGLASPHFHWLARGFDYRCKTAGLPKARLIGFPRDICRRLWRRPGEGAAREKMNMLKIDARRRYFCAILPSC